MSARSNSKKFTAYHAIIGVLVVITVVDVAAVILLRPLARRILFPNDIVLSDRTVRLIESLEQPVTITCWDKATGFRDAHALLDGYGALSSRVRVRYIDVDRNVELAKAAGVKKYGTISVEAGNRKQIARSLTEAEVTGAVVRASAGRERTACFVLGSGEGAIADTERKGYSTIKGQLEENSYRTDSVVLLEKVLIPSTCTVLVVGGPRQDYGQPEVNAIKAFVEHGGRALFMLDPPLKMAGEGPGDNEALVNVLSGWGVTAQKDLVIDVSGLGRLFGAGPEYPVVTTYESHEIVREMKGAPVVFSLSRSLAVKDGERTRVEKLFSTSENSFATASLHSTEIKPSDSDKKGPLLLAAAGTYRSGGEGGVGRFVVVGNSGWVANAFIHVNGNSDLFLNMMHWLFADEEGTSTPSKGA